MRLAIEPAMCAEILCQWCPKIIPPIRIRELIGLLGFVSVSRKIAIEVTRNEFVRQDCFGCRKADIHFPPSMMCGPVNGARCDFRLKDRRHGLWLAGQPALHPFELRRIERGQLHHR
jgi:hypothetical protein